MDDEKKEFTQEMFDSIDWLPLVAKLSGLLNVNVYLNRRLTEGACRGNKIVIESQNLANQAGVMSPVFKDLFVTDFGGKYEERYNTYWLPIHFHWEHKDGGSNGCNLLDAFYDFNSGQWKFKMRQER